MRSRPLRSEPAAYFSVSAEAIALPTLMKWPLGGNISSLSLDGVLNGPLPEIGMLRVGPKLGAMPAGRWRSAISRWGGGH